MVDIRVGNHYHDIKGERKGLWALIPARSGSKRVPNKNIRLLGGKPLIQWTVEAAQESELFERIVIASDLELPFQTYRRTRGLADDSPDIEWIKEVFEKEGTPDYFMNLRPTSPFRTASDIVNAWDEFKRWPYATSLRSVRPAPNPFKMWRQMYPYIIPAFHHEPVNGQSLYNLPSQLAPKFYIQCGAIEIAESRNVLFRNNVSGKNVVPYYMDERSGFDINTEFDWKVAEMIAKE